MPDFFELLFAGVFLWTLYEFFQMAEKDNNEDNK